MNKIANHLKQASVKSRIESALTQLRAEVNDGTLPRGEVGSIKDSTTVMKFDVFMDFSGKPPIKVMRSFKNTLESYFGRKLLKVVGENPDRQIISIYVQK